MPSAPQETFAAPLSSSNKSTATYTETRLRLQTPRGSLTKTFAVDATLFEVASAIQAEQPGFEPSSFMQTFPKKSEILLTFLQRFG